MWAMPRRTALANASLVVLAINGLLDRREIMMQQICQDREKGFGVTNFVHAGAHMTSLRKDTILHPRQSSHLMSVRYSRFTRGKLRCALVVHVYTFRDITDMP